MCCPDVGYLQNCLCKAQISSTIYTCVIHLQYCVICVAVEEECVTGEVRLVGGVTNSSSGLLEVCANGGWGTVCDYWNEWSYENAVVVCRQLHLPMYSE